MIMKLTWSYKSYNFGSQYNITNRQSDQLIEFFKMKPQVRQDQPLGGRVGIIPAHIRGLGNVAVKRYARGGLVSYFQKKRYLKWGITRCQREYEMLMNVREKNINTPEPVAFAWKGWPFYKCWLVTKRIDQSKTLVEIAVENPDAAVQHTRTLMHEVEKLIRHNIHHVDLHPGNVLVDAHGTVFIIDFDKAVQFQNGRNILREKYIARWKRAVHKYQLPETLVDVFDYELSHISMGL